MREIVAVSYHFCPTSSSQMGWGGGGGGEVPEEGTLREIRIEYN